MRVGELEAELAAIGGDKNGLAGALAEAEARRNAAAATKIAKELGGRNGPEPTRFGDWEKKGIAVDF